MSLNWFTVEECRAVSKHGTYRIFQGWGGKNNRYVAVLSWFDTDGRLFEHVIGLFDTTVEAKSACERDEKGRGDD